MLTDKAMSKNDKNDMQIPELLTLKEASEILKCHPNTLRQWDRDGVLKAIRFGKRQDRRYRKKDILNLLETK